MKELDYQKFGIIKVANVVANIRSLDVWQNAKNISCAIKTASDSGASLVVFGQNVLTGLSCGNAILTNDTFNKCRQALNEIKQCCTDIIAIVGSPYLINNRLVDCFFVISDNQILGVVPCVEVQNSLVLPDFDDEQQIPVANNLRFVSRADSDFNFCVVSGKTLFSDREPDYLKDASINIVIDDSPALIGQSEYRRMMVGATATRTRSTVIYNSAGFDNSGSDIVYDGDLFVCTCGNILSESKRHALEPQIVYSTIDTKMAKFDKINDDFNKNSCIDVYFNLKNKKFKLDTDIYQNYLGSPKSLTEKTFSEIIEIATNGLCKRLLSLPTNTKCVLGLSGGLDSTFALMTVVNALGKLGRPKSDIVAVTMPGFGTTSLTKNNAVNLCKNLGIECEEHSIVDIAKKMLDTVEQSETEKNTVYENVQARARTFLLMTIANKVGAIVIGTGDLSEIALGWATYNGDHISMYNPNGDIPKTVIKALVHYLGCKSENVAVGNILKEISEQVISPELLPSENDKIAQSTEQIVGPYELHDFFLYYFVRYGFSKEKIAAIAEVVFEEKYDSATICKWLETFLKRFAQNQWKRDCSPAGAKIGTVDLCPRGGWNMATDIKF